MNVAIETIRKTLVSIVKKRSALSDDDAQLLASMYLEGELEGKQTHGLIAFKDLLPKLSDARVRIEILKETKSFLYIDVHGSFGEIVGPKIADQVIKKAREQGLASAAIRQMKSWLRPGAIAQYIAEQGMIGLVFNTGGAPAVVAPGSREPAIGTNPIGIGIPTSGDPIVTDMATSMRAWGEVRLAQRSGGKLPDRAYLDKSGQITRDPNEAYSAVAMGDYKGFALGLLIEILGGAFVDMPMGGSVETDDAYHVRKRGATIVVLDPSVTVGESLFRTSTSGFVDWIRHLTPVTHSQTVTLPGDRSRKIRTSHLRSGELDVDDSVWSEILEFAK